MMIKRYALCAALSAAALALAACGGGDSSDDTTTPPLPPSKIDRIEPLDTAAPPQRAPLKAAPVAVSRMPLGAVAAQVALEPLVNAKLAAPRGKGVALQLGQGRAVQAAASPDDLTARLRWSALADGSQVAAVAFSSAGARATRLGVLARGVPAGTVLRFYGADGADVVEMSAAQLDALRQANEAAGVQGDAARMVWGPYIAGDASTLEVQLAAGADPSQLQLAVPQLAHLTQTVLQTLQQPKGPGEIGAAGSCNLDVMCNADLQAESRAVAAMIFISGNTPYACTGTLLNDAPGSRTPYFMTANHCISTQAEASTLVTYWFFRAAACNSSPVVDQAMTQLTGGARLLYTEAAGDVTLLQLNGQPPAGVVYAGSYFGAVPAAGTGVVGIHDPKGDLQKYSVGSITGYANCDATTCNLGVSAARAAMYQIGWTQGVTEGGSSGSAIFVKLGNTRYAVGALHGGNTDCQNQKGSDFYGRLDRAYNRGASAWLNP